MLRQNDRLISKGSDVRGWQMTSEFTQYRSIGERMRVVHCDLFTQYPYRSAGYSHSSAHPFSISFPTDIKSCSWCSNMFVTKHTMGWWLL